MPKSQHQLTSWSFVHGHYIILKLLYHQPMQHGPLSCGKDEGQLMLQIEMAFPPDQDEISDLGAPVPLTCHNKHVEFIRVIV